MYKSICIGTLPGSSLDERFANAAANGFRHVEVGTPESDAETQAIAEAAGRHEVAIPSIMCSGHWAHPLSHPDRSERDQGIDSVRRSLEAAATLGADAVLVVPGVVTPDTPYEEVWKRSQETIASLLPDAERHGVAIGIENVWNKFLLTAADFARYIDEFESDFVRAYFDVGNVVVFGFPQHWVRVLGRRIAKVHIKGFDANAGRFCWLEESTIDWPAVVAALRDAGYDGPLTAELPVDEEDPLGRLRRTAGEMDRILAY